MPTSNNHEPSTEAHQGNNEPANRNNAPENHDGAVSPGATNNGPSSFFSMENLKVAQVNIIGGTMNGFTIGFVAVYANFFQTSTDCSLHKTEVACDNVLNAECQWLPASGETPAQCGWVDLTCSVKYPGDSVESRDGCNADSLCNWLYSDDRCSNPVGYTSSNSGIFAGAMILGCLLGSIYAGKFAVKVGNRLSFLIVGIVGIVCSVMLHVSAATNEFWVLCIGRLLLGAVMGLLCVACPMYVDQHANEKYKQMIGVLFQFFTTFGIMLAAGVGYGLGKSINFSKNTNMLGRMQGFVAVSTLLSLLFIYLSAAVGGEQKKQEEEADKADGEEEAKQMNIDEHSWVSMTRPLIVAVLLAGTLQLTGINAVMNYAPTIMGNLGLEPLLGNFIVMIWNCVTTVVSIPLASHFSMRHMFLGGSIVASCACLFLCGIPVYPGVTSREATKNGVAITGIAIFIAAFEMGIGPCFYVLSQELFPRSFRPKGSSFTMVVQFIFNLIINVCYPIATESISGGPSGNQDKGQAIAFIFFGCIGLLCFVGQLFFLFPWEEKEPAKGAAPAASDECIQSNAEGEGDEGDREGNQEPSEMSAAEGEERNSGGAS